MTDYVTFVESIENGRCFSLKSDDSDVSLKLVEVYDDGQCKLSNSAEVLIYNLLKFYDVPFDALDVDVLKLSDIKDDLYYGKLRDFGLIDSDTGELKDADKIYNLLLGHKIYNAIKFSDSELVGVYNVLRNHEKQDMNIVYNYKNKKKQYGIQYDERDIPLLNIIKSKNKKRNDAVIESYVETTLIDPAFYALNIISVANKYGTSLNLHNFEFILEKFFKNSGRHGLNVFDVMDGYVKYSDDDEMICIESGQETIVKDLLLFGINSIKSYLLTEDYSFVEIPSTEVALKKLNHIEFFIKEYQNPKFDFNSILFNYDMDIFEERFMS